MPASSTSSAARRCVLSVATGPYVARQARLLETLRAAGAGIPVLSWTGALPPGSPPHEEAPYAFKLAAVVEAARRGFTSLLWLDAPCEVLRAPDAVFERMERDGHLFVTGDAKLGNWASDACLEAAGLPRDRAMSVPLLSGTFVGLDLSNARTQDWVGDVMDAAARGLLAGPHLSDHAPAEARARRPDRAVGAVSTDPRAWGHRHDEAVGSAAAWRRGMEVSPFGPLFSPDRAADPVVWSPEA